MIQLLIYEEFSHWLDCLLESNDMPEETKAYCFNLYEESAEEHIYGIQLIAAGEYDPADEGGEWACDEVWTSGEDVFTVDTSDEEDTGSAHAQELYTEMVNEYLTSGSYRSVLTGRAAVGIGFVDGDLDLIYRAEDDG